MLRKRLTEDDCNAGAIFDNLASQYWQDDKVAIELICEAVPEQNVEVVLFNFNKEQPVVEEGEDAAEANEVCTNYRYSRRHDKAHIPKEEDQNKDAESVAAQTKPKKPAKIQSSKRKDPKQKKDPAQIEADEKAAREAEESSKLKEAEAARKLAEEAARAAYKPKDYTSDEKVEWQKKKQDLEQFFSSIVMRQST